MIEGILWLGLILITPIVSGIVAGIFPQRIVSLPAGGVAMVSALIIYKHSPLFQPTARLSLHQVLLGGIVISMLLVGLEIGARIRYRRNTRTTI